MILVFEGTTRLNAFAKLANALRGKVVLVEGKHDIAALKAVGIEAKFVCANGAPSSIARKLEESGARKVFLMLDFDREGLRKQKFFKTFLEEQGFSVNAVFARKKRALLGFTAVEEIESKLDRLKKEIEEKGEFHGKNVR